MALAPPLKRLALRKETFFRTKNKDRKAVREALEETIETQFSRIRKAFAFKRAELTVDRTEDSGTIHAPLFEYLVHVEPEEDGLRIHQEVVPGADRLVLKNERFQEAFSDLYEEVVGEFSAPADLPSLIDKLEEEAQYDLEYDSRCSWAELRWSGFTGVIRLEPKGLKIRISGARQLDEVLAALQ